MGGRLTQRSWRCSARQLDAGWVGDETSCVFVVLWCYSQICGAIAIADGAALCLSATCCTDAWLSLCCQPHCSNSPDSTVAWAYYGGRHAVEPPALDLMIGMLFVACWQANAAPSSTVSLAPNTCDSIGCVLHVDVAAGL